MKKIILQLITSVCILASGAGAQTDPEPFIMKERGNFTFTSWQELAPAGTYPSNMVFHIMGPEAPVTLHSVATEDVTGAYNNRSGTRINGLNEDGIAIANQTLETESGYKPNRNGEVVLALNTIGRANVSVAFTAATLEAGSPFTASSLRVQYRTHENGNWSRWKEISSSPVEFTSSESKIPQAFTPVKLPDDANNKENIQVRWLFYHVQGRLEMNYKSPVIRLDDIKVTSVPIVTLERQNACSGTTAFSLSGGFPEGGVFSGNFVNGDTFNAAAAGAGNHTITYTFTDHNGISNSATSTVSVDLINCTTQLTERFCGMSEMNLSQNIFVDPVAGAEDYQFEFSSRAIDFIQIANRGNSNPVIYLGAVKGLKYGHTYDVRVKFRVGSSWSEFGPVCQISLQDNIPMTQLSDQSCGVDGLDLNSTIHADAIAGATNYEFLFINESLNYSHSQRRGNSNPLLPLSTVEGLRYGFQYHVQVRTMVGGEWSEYGSVCVIDIGENIPLTGLSPESCDATGLTLNSTIHAIKVAGADDYEFRFTDSSNNFSVSQNRGNPNPLLPLHTVKGLKYGKKYLVDVRAMVGGVWTDFGDVCSISLQDGIPLTKLTDEFCNRSDIPIVTTLHAHPVAGALNYNFLFTDVSCTDSISLYRGNSNALLPINESSGLEPGIIYHVRIRANVGGIWSDYGPVCHIAFVNNNRASEAILSQKDNSSLIEIYPNPTTGIFNIQTNNENSTSVQIYNMAGQVVASENTSGKLLTFNLSEFKKGIYFVRIESQGNVQYERIVLSD